AAPDRRRERALDADEVLAERVDGRLGQPVAGLLDRGLPRQHLLPRDPLAVPGRGGVEYMLGRRPDVDAGAVTAHERDDGLVGNAEDAAGRHRDVLGHEFEPTGRQYSGDQALVRRRRLSHWSRTW